MIEQPFKSFHSNLTQDKSNEFIGTVTKEISLSQNFIRNNCDISSENLQEVNIIVIG